METFKVLITGADSVYSKNSIIEVVEFNDDNFMNSLHQEILIPKHICHIIRPHYEVAEEAARTGKDVESWDRKEKSWFGKVTDFWHDDGIYRIEPEPAIRPYTFSEAVKEFTKNPWINYKGDCHFQVVAIYPEGVKVIGEEIRQATYESLARIASHLDGRPCGKEVNNEYN